MDGDSEGITIRKVIDESKNSQGEVLFDLLKGIR